MLYQGDHPRVTRYIEECCQVLSNSDDPNDKSALALVNSQLIVERMTQGPWNGDAKPMSMPTQFFVKAIQEQVRTFGMREVEETQQDCK